MDGWIDQFVSEMFLSVFLTYKKNPEWKKATKKWKKKKVAGK